MSTKARIQKVRAEVEAHEERGWLKGYEQGLAVREEQIVDLQSALEVRNETVRELGRQKNGPRTAREALALAWELAHPVKEGQVIPAGTQHIHKTLKTFFVREMIDSCEASSWDEANIRTLVPLPEPDWLDAPAVMSVAEGFSYRRIWVPLGDGGWASVQDGRAHWSKLRDVTPLYPKEDE